MPIIIHLLIIVGVAAFCTCLMALSQASRKDLITVIFGLSTTAMVTSLGPLTFALISHDHPLFVVTSITTLTYIILGVVVMLWIRKVRRAS